MLRLGGSAVDPSILCSLLVMALAFTFLFFRCTSIDWSVYGVPETYLASRDSRTTISPLENSAGGAVRSIARPSRCPAALLIQIKAEQP